MIACRFQPTVRLLSPATSSLVTSFRQMSVQAAGSSVASANAKPVKPQPKIISACKSNIDQSPWRMRFLAMLVRDKWVPDALAQMKFSPKHKAVDVAQIIRRGCALAKIHHNAIPEELWVSEILTNKGSSHKKLRIMGRGRTGIGMMRKTHVSVKLEVIDFDDRIAKAESASQKYMWIQKKLKVQALKKSLSTPPATTA